MRKLPAIRVIALDIVSHPNADQATFAVSILKREKCAILFTINEWGIDSSGIIQEYLEKNGIVYINWCVDDPFYEELFAQKKYFSFQNRIDFVSDRDYLKKMSQYGFNAEFLPLATDPSLFFPMNLPEDKTVAFVGNSYISQVDKFVEGVFDVVQPVLPFLASLLIKYKKDCVSVNIEYEIEKQVRSLHLPGTVSSEKMVFICKHIAGYLYRKELICYCADRFSGFQIYGDTEWESVISKSRLGRVKYGEELCKLYNTVKVNLDCNRAVIRDGFTQRTFDVLACNKFLITGAKPVAEEMFKTEGTEKEIVMFRNQEELVTQIEYYLSHEKERFEIAKRGYNRVLKEHTYDHRIRQMFSKASSLLSYNLL